MADLNRPAEPKSFLEEPRKLPEMINVLTILTFIGSGLGIIGSLWGFSSAKKAYEQMSTMSMEQLPDFAKRMMGNDPVEAARRTLEYRLPILLINLVAIALCIYGATEMRKLKKTGFTMYAIGEILPIAGALIFLGSAATGTTYYISYCISIVFVVLYASQLKYLR